MMRLPMTRARAMSWVLGLSTLVAASGRSQAQDVIAPGSPIEQSQDHGLRHLFGHFQSRRPPIPRTYSYYYNTWFNQPCHFRVVGPDGKTSWRTTVRGLPMGTPWPSYGAPGQP
jgi:hypothetical protein